MKKILSIAALLAVAGFQVRAQDGFVKTVKGNLVKNFTNKPGDKIKVDDVITFDVVQKTDKDSLLGSSYTSGHQVKIQVQAPQNTPDLMDVFPMLAAQDSACVKVPTDSIFKGHDAERPPFFPKGSFLICYIKIQRVQSLNDAIGERNKAIDSMRNGETAAREKYITDHKLVLKTTPSGLKYMITKPSLKPKPLAGDTVIVDYTGRLLDGTVFDTSIKEVAQKSGTYQEGRPYEPLKFPVGKQNVIAGWDEGLLLVNNGAKATFIVPSNLAYGDQGSGAIPPFSTLVFEVEMKGIHPIKHPPVKHAVKKAVTKKHTTTTKKS
jgi:FKBP-type peptidyl-prolyl cis-trans isomerase FkpA